MSTTNQTNNNNNAPPARAPPIDTTRTMINVIVTSPQHPPSHPLSDVTTEDGVNKRVTSSVTSSAGRNQVHPEVDEQDEIGVTLDYDFPQHPNYDVDTTTNNSDDVTNNTTSSSRRQDRQSRDERRRRRRRRRERVGFLEFYRKHWFGQFASGMFTGLIFLVIGLVFIIVFKDLPTYIGVLFILVSFPPCCLSVNRLRHARAAERLRRENLNRLRALRRMHRQNRGANDVTREIPFADLPPSYNNLGFVGNEAELETGEISRGSSMTSSLSETDLPSYEEAIRIKQEIEEELAREREENNQQQHRNQREIIHPLAVPSSSQMVDEIRSEDEVNNRPTDQ